LISCDRKTPDRKELEHLEDRVTELEDENRSLREQLEEARSSPGDSSSGEAAGPAAAASETPQYPHDFVGEYPGLEAPDEIASPPDDADDGAAMATAREAAEVAESAREAEQSAKSN
jgi:hypothetical protein